MDVTAWSKKVQTVLERFQAEGTFTHAYASTGTLGSNKSLKEVSLLPDGANLFDLASTTKALVTTPLFFRLQRLGQLHIDMTLAAWLGERVSDLAPTLRSLTIRSLLRHESGLPAWYNFWICRLGSEKPEAGAYDSQHRHLVDVLNRAATSVTTAQPPRQVYSDVGFLLLGLGLERFSRKSLADLFAEFCTDELKLSPDEPLAYGPNLRQDQAASVAQFVPTSYCAIRRRELRGEVHDENCASLGGVTSHSGLFGSGTALSHYLQSLADSPTGKLMLQENAAAVADPRQKPLNDSLIGLRQGSDPVAASFGQGRSMGHYGWTGTAFWIEPSTGPIGTWRFVTLLTNRVSAGRVPVKGKGISLCRKEVFETTHQLT